MNKALFSANTIIPLFLPPVKGNLCFFCFLYASSLKLIHTLLYSLNHCSQIQNSYLLLKGKTVVSLAMERNRLRFSPVSSPPDCVSVQRVPPSPKCSPDKPTPPKSTKPPLQKPTPSKNKPAPPSSSIFPKKTGFLCVEEASESSKPSISRGKPSISREGECQ